MKTSSSKVFSPPNGYFVYRPRYYWDPKPDITVYELAICLNVLLSLEWENFKTIQTSLPINAMRHFQEVDEKNENEETNDRAKAG